MAYCAALTCHGAEGKGIHTIRHGYMPTGQPELLTQGIAADVHRLLERQSSLRVPVGRRVPQNVEPHAACARGRQGSPRVRRLWHLMEKLHSAVAVIHHDDANAKEAAWRWRQSLRKRSSGALEILEELEASECEHHWRDDQQPVHEAITYIRNNGERMNYASALRRGLRSAVETWKPLARPSSACA